MSAPRWGRYTVALAVVACSSPQTAPVDSRASIDTFAPPDADPLCGDASGAPTFANVEQVFTACAGCHALGAPLDLRPTVAYRDLVGQPTVNYTDPPTDESCGVVLVDPGNATNSFLFQKLSLPAPCAGAQMPLGEISSVPLDGCRQTLIRDWINSGAPDD